MGGRDREFGIDQYTLLYLKQITHKDCIAQGTQCSVAAQMGRKFRGEQIHVHVWLRPFVVCIKRSTTLLISYTLIQNKNLKNKIKTKTFCKMYCVLTQLIAPFSLKQFPLSSEAAHSTPSVPIISTIFS